MVICANYPYREFVGDLLQQTVEDAGITYTVNGLLFVQWPQFL